MLPFNFHLIVGFFLFYSFSLCVYLFVRMIEIWKRVKKSPLSYAHQRYIIYEIPLLFLQYFFLSLLSKTRNRENERDNSATILLTRIRNYENNGIIFMKIISNNLLPLFWYTFFSLVLFFSSWFFLSTAILLFNQFFSPRFFITLSCRFWYLRAPHSLIYFTGRRWEQKQHYTFVLNSF